MRGWTAAGLALGVLVAASLGIGAGDLSGADGGQLFLASRMPRTAAAFLAGAGLALAGAVVQMAVQNRLVEPGLTGTPESAMAGLLAVTLIAPGTPLLGKMIVASVAALAGTAGFLLLARHIPREDPILLPLVGLVYGGILGSAVTWIGWTTDLMQLLSSWQLGEFSGILQGRYELLWLIAGLAALLYAIADRITMLSLGEDRARSLGLDYRGTLLSGLVVVAVIVRQSLLARTAPDGTLEWYPPGLLLVVLTGLGLVGLLLAALLTLGDPGGLEGSVRQFLSIAFGDAAAGTAGAEEPLSELIDGFAQVFPGMVVVSWLTMAIINAALAQGVLMRFGRNLRPAMRVAEVELPNWTPMLLAAAGVLALLGGEGQLGYLALNAAIVLLVPFFFAGLAVVHAFAGGRQARTLLLMVFYFFLLVSGWPIAMVVGLGVIEQWAGLRRRFSRTGPDQES